MKTIFRTIGFFVAFYTGAIVCASSTAHAVLPIDVVFQVGSQMAIIFGMVIAFLSTLAVSFYSYARLSLKKFHLSKKVLALGVVLLVLIALVIAYFIDQYQQDQQKENQLDTVSIMMYVSQTA